jgi:hypothetical protein
VRVFITLLVIALIEASLSNRLARSVVLVTLILLLKPQWACVLALPLLLGQRRFFLKLVAQATAAYHANSGLTIATLGLEYGMRQYHDYARLLAHMNDIFPWRTLDAGVLGANHSVTQLVIYFFGATSAAFRLATAAKLALLAPLVVLALRYLRRPASQLSRHDAATSIDLALALCLGGYMALDLVWADDFFLGIAILPYLLARLPARLNGAKGWIWLFFAPYALVDFLRIAGFAALGPNVMITTPYLDLARTDPSIYVPLAILVILMFYALLMRWLWAREAAARDVAAPEFSESRP